LAGNRSRSIMITRVVAILSLILALGLVACGGDDDDANGGTSTRDGVPLVQGADEIASYDFTDEDRADMGVAVSGGRTVAYKTETSVDDATAFYSGTSVDDWTIVSSQSFGEAFMAVLNKGNDIAIVMVTTGSAAKANTDIMQDEDLDLQPDDFDDDDALVLIADFTCTEPDVATCLAGAAL
jgi:hypothetical protein